MEQSLPVQPGEQSQEPSTGWQMEWLAHGQATEHLFP